jgi:1-deoxy-D-xylulose 5-phosphate reductoisomerase
VAVLAFLEGRIPLTAIAEIVEGTLEAHDPATVVSVVSLGRADAWARRRAVDLLERR